MKIVYKIKDGSIISWKDILIDETVYILKENEMFGDRFEQPARLTIVNGIVVNEWSQADTDAKIEEDAEQNALNIVSQRIADGEEFFNKVATKVKRTYDDGNITQTQFKNIRVSLKDVLLPLRFGDWDLSQDNINLVNRPSGQLGGLYDFLKNKIDQYVLDNY